MDAATGVWDNAVMSVKLIDFQKAQRELKRELDKFRSGKFVTVGIHEDAGKTEDGQMTQAQNGALQNFGNDKIPARPWLIPGVQSGIRDINDQIEHSIANGATPDDTLDAVGAIAAGAVQQYVTDLKNPPNAQYTIDKKGSSNPLIDTGSMRASITWKVTDTKPEEGI